MSDAELSRVKQDLAVMGQAIGLHLPFGREAVAANGTLAVLAGAAAVLSLVLPMGLPQLVPLAAVALAVPVGLYVHSRLKGATAPEVAAQLLWSIGVHGLVWFAACNYVLADLFGQALGLGQHLLGYISTVTILFGFALGLVVKALRRREQACMVGLAVPLMLAGMVMPLLDPGILFPLAHALMALGFGLAAGIQWVQLRRMGAIHGTD